MKNTELLKNTIALGTTSALAVVAASQQAIAEGAYFGFGVGAIAGESPNAGYAYDDYSLNGSVLSVFAGVDKDLGNNRFAGIELAYQGAANGNEQGNSYYDYSFQLNYVVDAKIRYGASFGQNLSAYGFVGASTGNANEWNGGYGGYSFFGANAGAGVQMEVVSGITAGVEYIHRFVKTGYDVGQDQSSDHGALSARISMNF
jgi:hypothetical protein